MNRLLILALVLLLGLAIGHWVPAMIRTTCSTRVSLPAGYTIRADSTGQWIAYRPDGSVLPTPNTQTCGIQECIDAAAKARP